MLHEKSRHRLQYYIDNNPHFQSPPPPKKIIRDRDIFNRILDKLRTLREGKLFKKKEYKPMDRAVIHCRNLKSDQFTIHYAECNMLQIAIPFVT